MQFPVLYILRPYCLSILNVITQLLHLPTPIPSHHSHPPVLGNHKSDLSVCESNLFISFVSYFRFYEECHTGVYLF